VIALIPIVLIHFADATAPRTLVAKVQRVSDGDTITAISSNQTKLRLLGIEAPGSLTARSQDSTNLERGSQWGILPY